MTGRRGFTFSPIVLVFGICRKCWLEVRSKVFPHELYPVGNISSLIKHNPSSCNFQNKAKSYVGRVQRSWFECKDLNSYLILLHHTNDIQLVNSNSNLSKDPSYMMALSHTRFCEFAWTTSPSHQRVQRHFAHYPVKQPAYGHAWSISDWSINRSIEFRSSLFPRNTCR